MNVIHGMSKTRSNSQAQRSADTDFRIGMVRLTDAVPYIMAGELGYYREAGLSVQLSWELGWSSIKHKIAYRQLDAAHALAPMALSITHGNEVAAVPCRSLLVSSRMGNGITLAQHIRERGVSNAEDFRQEVRSSRGRLRYTLGVPSMDSSHHILLRRWLRNLQLDPDKDVRIIVIPPGQALRNLRAHTLDGYCVGEPWNSIAVLDGLGWVMALSQDLSPGHVEKVLLAREDLCREKPEAVNALTDVLKQACRFCANPENAAIVARKLRRNVALGPAARGMERILRGSFDYGDGGKLRELPVIEFCTDGQHRISDADLHWLVDGCIDCGWLRAAPEEAKLLAQQVYQGKH